MEFVVIEWLVGGTAEVQSLWFSHPYIIAVLDCSCRPDKLTPTMTMTMILFTFLRPRGRIAEQLYCVSTNLDTNEHRSKTVESYNMKKHKKPKNINWSKFVDGLSIKLSVSVEVGRG